MEDLSTSSRYMMSITARVTSPMAKYYAVSSRNYCIKAEMHSFYYASLKNSTPQEDSEGRSTYI